MRLCTERRRKPSATRRVGSANALEWWMGILREHSMIRRVRIYRCTDCADILVGRTFDLRAAEALELARRQHYGDHGTFSTSNQFMIVDQPFHNKDLSPTGWESPRFMAISTDDDLADMDEPENSFRREAAALHCQVEIVGSGEYDIEAKRWVRFEEIVG